MTIHKIWYYIFSISPQWLRWDNVIEAHLFTQTPRGGQSETKRRPRDPTILKPKTWVLLHDPEFTRHVGCANAQICPHRCVPTARADRGSFFDVSREQCFNSSGCQSAFTRQDLSGHAGIFRLAFSLSLSFSVSVLERAPTHKGARKPRLPWAINHWWTHSLCLSPSPSPSLPISFPDFLWGYIFSNHERITSQLTSYEL